MKAGLCGICGENVYLDESGNCINGHAAENVSDVYEVADLEAVTPSMPTQLTPPITPDPPEQKATRPLIIALIAAGLVFGLLAGCPMGFLIGSGSSTGSTDTTLSATQLAELKDQVAALTEERDGLKQELDPIKRAEEASAAAEADKLAAEAKAKSDAEAAAAKTKSDAEAAAAEAAAKAAALAAANTFTDGIYLVGEDIKPGTYRGTVTSSMGTGYWARLRDTDGGVNSIIANGLPGGPFVLTIKPTDKAVELTGVKLVLK